MIQKFIFLAIFAVSLFSYETFTNYQKGLEYAKANGKSMLVVIEQEGCPWCAKFRGTLANDRVQKVLEEQFVLIFLDKDKNPPSIFSVPMTPVSFIMNSDEEILMEVIGYAPTKKLLLDIEIAFEEL